MEKHFVYFDGTSHWVGSEYDNHEDYTVIYDSYDLEECQEVADEANKYL